jgi:hypothetical protein
MNVYVFDNARWHGGNDFPADLDEYQAAVHMGLFLAWCIARDLHDAEFFTDVGLNVVLDAVRARQLTGAQLLEPLAGVLAGDELNAEGNAFARAYYETLYRADYLGALAGGLPSMYHVPDTWESFERLRPVLDRRYAEWVAAGRPGELGRR